jgi:hypothetical protein
VIEVTPEMVQEIYSRIDFQMHGDDGIAEGLAVVLAIVERGLPRCPYVEWGFKVRLCSLPFGHDGDHGLKDRVIV